MAAHLALFRPTPGPPHGCWSSHRSRDRALCLLRLGTCLNAHFHKINAVASPSCPGLCAQAETVHHFLLECFLYAGQRQALQRDVAHVLGDPSVQLSLPLLLGTVAPVAKRGAVFDAVWLFLQRCKRQLSSHVPVV